MPKLDSYSANDLGPLLLPAVSNSSLGVKMSFSSGNVYITNGHTDRILVPYCYSARRGGRVGKAFQGQEEEEEEGV
jgi:hypothetical protein